MAPANRQVLSIEVEINDRVPEEDISVISTANHLHQVGAVWIEERDAPAAGYASIGQGAVGVQTGSALSQAYSGPNAYSSGG